VLAAVLGAAACASAPRSPFFGDEKYLRFGVDPRAEANAVVQAHEERGFRVVRRIEGQAFTALGFVGSRPHVQSVRVVTSRGIQLALDPQSEANPDVTSYELLAPPIDGTQDADADGFEEIFVRATARAGDACLQVYRVRDVGFVDALPIELALFGTRCCASDVEDLDGDGRAELVAEVRLDDRAEPARVRVPLWADAHRFVLRPGSAATLRFVSAERRAREEALARARLALDVDASLGLTIELSALAMVAGEPCAARVRVFDSALAGLVLEQDQAQAVSVARARIADGCAPARSPKIAPAAKNAAPSVRPAP
jgi:hypothetical protein